ncbi:MAG: P-type conjugative transfer protein TrbJ [Sulfitobacter sp.]
MKAETKPILKKTICAAALATCLAMATLTPAKAWKTVFDPWNYRQNILTAVRSLSEVNQQIEQLRNEAQMITKMDLDLTKLGSTISPELARTLSEMKTLMDQGNAIKMQVEQTSLEMHRLFPDEFANALTGDDVVKDAKERWDQTLSAYKRSANLQAKISENIEVDSGLLDTLLDRSRSSVGNLQASQAGNELTGLSVKQSLQLQQLMAAQYRAETLERSRRMAAEEEARVRFNGFLGSKDSSYSPGG